MKDPVLINTYVVGYLKPYDEHIYSGLYKLLSLCSMNFIYIILKGKVNMYLAVLIC